MRHTLRNEYCSQLMGCARRGLDPHAAEYRSVGRDVIAKHNEKIDNLSDADRAVLAGDAQARKARKVAELDARRREVAEQLAKHLRAVAVASSNRLRRNWSRP